MNLLLKTGGGSVSVTALASAGISQDKDGNLKLDDTKLQAALKTDSSAVAKLFTNDGRGIADLLSAKATSLTSTNSVLTKETSLTTNEITSLNSKKAAMTKAMTAQANALAALYTAQAKPAPAAPGAAAGHGNLVRYARLIFLTNSLHPGDGCPIITACVMNPISEVLWQGSSLARMLAAGLMAQCRCQCARGKSPQYLQLVGLHRRIR
jgi:hypothetical protein